MRPPSLSWRAVKNQSSAGNGKRCAPSMSTRSRGSGVQRRVGPRCRRLGDELHTRGRDPVLIAATQTRIRSCAAGTGEITVWRRAATGEDDRGRAGAGLEGCHLRPTVCSSHSRAVQARPKYASPAPWRLGERSGSAASAGRGSAERYHAPSPVAGRAVIAGAAAYHRRVHVAFSLLTLSRVASADRRRTCGGSWGIRGRERTGPGHRAGEPTGNGSVTAGASRDRSSCTR